MKWIVALLILVNIGLVVGVSYWSSPGKLDVEGGQGKLPRVSDLKVDAERPKPEPPAPIPEISRQPDASPTSSPVGGAREDSVEERDSQTGRSEGICGRIERFVSQAQVQDFSATQKDVLQRAAVVEQIDPRPSYHWVLIPPLASRSDALDKLAELQRAGIDSYLVTEGEYRNAISLGLFESEKLAQDLNARFQSRNVETVLANKDRNQISYALVFEVADEAGLDRLTKAAQRIVGDLNSVENASCEGVASPDKNP